MKGLSLWEPYASLIALGYKTVETRSWATPYRGRLLIHAAKKWDGGLEELSQSWPFSDLLSTHWEPSLGKAVAIATLAGCFQMEQRHIDLLREEADRTYGQGELTKYAREYYFGNWEVGRYGWALEDVQALDPIPVRGSQALWTVPSDVAAAAFAQARQKALK